MKSLFVLAAAAVIGFASPAIAGNTSEPDDTDTTCGSYCVPEADVTLNSTTIFAEGGAIFEGIGAAYFEGLEGYAYAEKEGEGGVDIEIGSNGICVSCADINGSLSAYARENVRAGAGATSNEAGTGALVSNAGQAVSGTYLTFGFSNLAASAPVSTANTGQSGE